MTTDEIKAMFPDFHPGDYIYSVAECCGSCSRGVKTTYSIDCRLHGGGRSIEMFPYGYCPQYERNPAITMPVVMKSVSHGQYGNGQG